MNLVQRGFKRILPIFVMMAVLYAAVPGIQAIAQEPTAAAQSYREQIAAWRTITDAVHAKQAPQLADVLSVELPQYRRAELTHGSKGQDCVVLPNPSVDRRLARWRQREVARQRSSFELMPFPLRRRPLDTRSRRRGRTRSSNAQARQPSRDP